MSDKYRGWFIELYETGMGWGGSAEIFDVAGAWVSLDERYEDREEARKQLVLMIHEFEETKRRVEFMEAVYDTLDFLCDLIPLPGDGADIPHWSMQIKDRLERVRNAIDAYGKD